MSFGYSVIIEDRTGHNRFLFFVLKYFLELSGYTVLEDRKGRMSIADGRFVRFVLIAGDIPERDRNNEVRYLQTGDTVKLLEDSCRCLAEDEDDLKALLRLQKEYSGALFQHFYTIGYLYANRDNEYKDKKLLDAAGSLAEICDRKEAFLRERQHSWRDTYAYLYMSNRVNEAMYKMRGIKYRPYNMLKGWIEEIRRQKGDYEGLALLEAEIIRNTENGLQKHMEAYKTLENAASYGVRYWALYAQGEISREMANKEYRLYKDKDHDCAIQVKLYEPAIEFFRKALVMKKDEPRILFKLGVQNEKKGLRDSGRLDEAKKQFETIIGVIEDIPVSQRNTLEYEYLYKTSLRIGQVLKLQGYYEEARRYYEKAERIWNTLENYTMIGEIYGKEEGPAVFRILDNKYCDRRKTFRFNHDELDLLQKRG